MANKTIVLDEKLHQKLKLYGVMNGINIKELLTELSLKFLAKKERLIPIAEKYGDEAVAGVCLAENLLTEDIIDVKIKSDILDVAAEKGYKPEDISIKGVSI